MPDDAETRYRESEEKRRDLEIKHRELERQVQDEANEERKNLRGRVEVLERQYMTSEKIDARFKELTDQIINLRIRVYGAIIALTILGGIWEAIHK